MLQGSVGVLLDSVIPHFTANNQGDMVTVQLISLQETKSGVCYMLISILNITRNRWMKVTSFQAP